MPEPIIEWEYFLPLLNRALQVDHRGLSSAPKLPANKKLIKGSLEGFLKFLMVNSK